MDKIEYRFRRAQLRPADKPFAKPNVLAVLGVLLMMALGALFLCWLHPTTALNDEITHVLMSGFSVLATAFGLLICGDTNDE